MLNYLGRVLQSAVMYTLILCGLIVAIWVGQIGMEIVEYGIGAIFLIGLLIGMVNEIPVGSN